MQSGKHLFNPSDPLGDLGIPLIFGLLIRNTLDDHVTLLHSGWVAS